MADTGAEAVRGRSGRGEMKTGIIPKYAVGLVAVLLVCGCSSDGGPAGVGSAPLDRPATAPAVAVSGVRGRVVYAGPIPTPTTRYVAQLDRVVDEHTVHVHPATGGVRDAVVFLRPESTLGADAYPAETERAEPPTVTQHNMVFIPHVLAVRAGRPVRFTNRDDDRHNIHAVSIVGDNMFNRYFGRGIVYEHTFRTAPRDFPVLLMCDLHDWMKAWVYAFDHPYFAVTDREGSFAIDHVPLGRYTLVVHHADGRLRLEQPIAVTVQESHTLTLTLEKKPDGSKSTP